MIAVLFLCTVNAVQLFGLSSGKEDAEMKCAPSKKADGSVSDRQYLAMMVALAQKIKKSEESEETCMDIKTKLGKLQFEEEDLVITEMVLHAKESAIKDEVEIEMSELDETLAKLEEYECEEALKTGDATESLFVTCSLLVAKRDALAKEMAWDDDLEDQLLAAEEKLALEEELIAFEIEELTSKMETCIKQCDRLEACSDVVCEYDEDGVVKGRQCTIAKKAYNATCPDLLVDDVDEDGGRKKRKGKKGKKKKGKKKKGGDDAVEEDEDSEDEDEDSEDEEEGEDGEDDEKKRKRKKKKGGKKKKSGEEALVEAHISTSLAATEYKGEDFSEAEAKLLAMKDVVEDSYLRGNTGVSMAEGGGSGGGGSGTTHLQMIANLIVEDTYSAVSHFNCSCMIGEQTGQTTFGSGEDLGLGITAKLGTCNSTDNIVIHGVTVQGNLNYTVDLLSSGTNVQGACADTCPPNPATSNTTHVICPQISGGSEFFRIQSCKSTDSVLMERKTGPCGGYFNVHIEHVSNGTLVVGPLQESVGTCENFRCDAVNGVNEE